MRNPFLFHAGLAALASGVLLLSPARSQNAPPLNSTVVAALAAEVQAQQKALNDNQTKIDAKLAEVGEALRQARIFVARGGGGGSE